MPAIKVTTTVKLTDEKMDTLRKAFQKAMLVIPGKTEKGVMTAFVPECNMFFHDEKKENCAFVEVHLFGATELDYKKQASEIISKALEEETDISPKEIYITYSEYSNWGIGSKLY